MKEETKKKGKKRITVPQISISKGKTKKYVRVKNVGSLTRDWTIVDELSPKTLAEAYILMKEEYEGQLMSKLENLAKRHGFTDEEIKEFHRWLEKEDELYHEAWDKVTKRGVKRFRRKIDSYKNMWKKILVPQPKRKRGRPPKKKRSEER